jgi:DNA-binding XRE family transcriptional regulator
VVAKLSREQLQDRRARAKEWADFRKNFLFSQRRLAEIVGCSRRTVVNIEAGAVTPHADLLHRFALLKHKHVTERNRQETGWAA